MKQREKLMSRNSEVMRGAEGIFNELWDEIVGFAREADAKGMPVKTNGSSFERIVLASEFPYFSNLSRQRNLTITLDRVNEKISASWLDEAIDLLIDVCDDGVICLKHEGKKILLKDAAKLILDPFLFPDLQPKKH